MTNSPSQTGQPSFPTTTRPLANPACFGGSYAINRISFSVTKTGTQAECGCAGLGNTIRFDLSAYKTFITGISRNPARMQPNFGHFASLSTGDLTQPRQPTHDQTKEHDHPSSCKMHRRLLAARYFWGQFQAGANHGHSDASSVLSREVKLRYCPDERINARLHGRWRITSIRGTAPAKEAQAFI